jgi:hypothetical protein
MTTIHADLRSLLSFLSPLMVGIMAYAPAIRNALKRGNLREMKALLKYSKKLLNQQGDLPKAVHRLEAAIRKLSRT